jgi:hypothetical protein
LILVHFSPRLTQEQLANHSFQWSVIAITMRLFLSIFRGGRVMLENSGRGAVVKSNRADIPRRFRSRVKGAISVSAEAVQVTQPVSAGGTG